LPQEEHRLNRLVAACLRELAFQLGVDIRANGLVCRVRPA
jgi:hypothetical protein